MPAALQIAPPPAADLISSDLTSIDATCSNPDSLNPDGSEPNPTLTTHTLDMGDGRRRPLSVPTRVDMEMARWPDLAVKERREEKYKVFEEASNRAVANLRAASQAVEIFFNPTVTAGRERFPI